MTIDTLKQSALADLIADAAISYSNGHATDWQEVAKQALAAITPSQETTIERLKQSALDHLMDCSAASFAEPLEGGLWLCVGTQESIAELVGERVAVPGAASARNYTTESGDMVAGIALRQLGAESRWTEITALNRRFSDMGPNDCYPVGTVLFMPTPTPPQQATPAEPIPMVLHCPACGLQHIDAPWRPGQYLTNDQITGAEPVWNNPPHRSHLCHQCGCIWRPADVPTIGVASIQTRGRSDSHATQAASTIAAAQPALTDGQIDDWIVTTATYDISGWRIVGKDQIRRFARDILRAALATRGATPPQAKEEE